MAGSFTTVQGHVDCTSGSFDLVFLEQVVDLWRRHRFRIVALQSEENYFLGNGQADFLRFSRSCISKVSARDFRNSAQASSRYFC